jgi:hypothetical protein
LLQTFALSRSEAAAQMKAEAAVAQLDHEKLKRSRMERAMDEKEEDYFRLREAARRRYAKLHGEFDTWVVKCEGQIPLEKAERWSVCIRELSAQKRALEMGDTHWQQEKRKLTEQMDGLKQEVARLEAVLKAKGSGKVDEHLVEWSHEVKQLKLSENRLLRQTKQLQAKEEYLSKVAPSEESLRPAGAPVTAACAFCRRTKRWRRLCARWRSSRGWTRLAHNGNSGSWSVKSRLSRSRSRRSQTSATA